jgi:formylglycine-generating enzyme required for sulfatase activity
VGERESQTETAASVRAALDSLGKCDASMLLQPVQVRGWLADAGIKDRAVLVAFGELASEGVLHAWWHGEGVPMEDATRTISALGMDSAVPRALLAQVLAPAQPQVRTVSPGSVGYGLGSHRDTIMHQLALWEARPPLVGPWGSPPHRPLPSGVAGNVEGVPPAAGGSGPPARSERGLTDEQARTLLEQASALPAGPSLLGPQPRRMTIHFDTSGGTRAAGATRVPLARHRNGAPPVPRGALSGPTQTVATGGARIQAARGVVLYLVAVCGGDWNAPLGLPSECPEGFVRIGPGSFTMGSPTGEEDRYSDEHQHSVTITRAFCMKTTEVTQGEWQAELGTNPSRFDACGANCPVEYVSWGDAIGYANALSRREGLPECYAGSNFTGLNCAGYRLPTESEWEYAARAGTFWSSYGILQSVGWYSDNSVGSTQAVGGKSANSFGVSDMLGNVWEWTNDWYGPYPATVTDPTGPTTGSERVFRGGSWNSDDRYLRAARRSSDPADFHYDYLGFRLARTAP